MKSVFIFMSLALVASNASANCLSQAQSAKSRGQNHLVITMEGLMGGIQGRAYQLAKTTNERNGSQATINAYSHAGGPSAALSCILQWKNTLGSQLRLTVVGHSFGGNAALRLADSLADKNIAINDLLVIDGRDGSESFGCRTLGKHYIKPLNVDRATAVYQNGCMAGRFFANGEGVTNIRESSGPLAHLNLPSSSGAIASMNSIFKRTNVPSVADAPEETIAVETSNPSNNAESASADTTVVTAPFVGQRTAARSKVYKCELAHLPGIYRECSKEERAALDKKPPRESGR